MSLRVFVRVKCDNICKALSQHVACTLNLASNYYETEAQEDEVTCSRSHNDVIARPLEPSHLPPSPVGFPP